MSKLAVHIQHFKRGAVGSIAGHNFYKRGDKDNHSNMDIDPERSCENVALVAPEGSFYQEVKEKVDQATGRVTKASVWVSEWIIYPPESLQNPLTADKSEVLRYFEDVHDWMVSKGYTVPLAVVHFDETTVHGHFDTVPLTADGRLSRKDVYSRQALIDIHTELAAHLQEKGWDIQRGDSTAAKQIRAVSVPEYKKQAEAQKQELLKDISAAKEEKADLQTEIDSLQAVLTEKEVNSIAAKKTVFGKTDIDWKDWERTRNTAGMAEQAIKDKEAAEARAQAAEEAAKAAEEREQAYYEQMQQWQQQTIADTNRQLQAMRAKDKEELDRERNNLPSVKARLQMIELQKEVARLQSELERMTYGISIQRSKIEKFLGVLPGQFGEKVFVDSINKATGMSFENSAQIVKYCTDLEIGIEVTKRKIKEQEAEK